MCGISEFAVVYVFIPVYAICTDGHHKSIRWKTVTHAGIDGFSRMIVYMKCSNNNKSSTVYNSFLEAIRLYGLPSRMRSDQGKTV